MDGIACMAKYVYVCTYNLYNTISKGTHILFVPYLQNVPSQDFPHKQFRVHICMQYIPLPW